MKVEELKYALGGENIASSPREVRLGQRDLGRMLVVDRQRKAQRHAFVRSLPELLAPGDVLVLNNSKRIPGLLKAHVAHNEAQVEVQFVHYEENDQALCRIYPGHHVRPGVYIRAGRSLFEVVQDHIAPNDLCLVKALGTSLTEILKAEGYPITSFFYSRYWEVEYLNPCFSSQEGAIESPLAGLHFTPRLLADLSAAGIAQAYITLHSVGSWLPFLEEDIEDHAVNKEWFHMPEAAADLINAAKERGNKVIACGSTAMRTVESAATNGRVRAMQQRSDLYIRPGHAFQVVDHYFTNFHPYRTSLMVLDAAFCGKDLLLESYEAAKREGYLFFEFGDAVLYL